MGRYEIWEALKIDKLLFYHGVVSGGFTNTRSIGSSMIMTLNVCDNSSFMQK